MRWIGQRGQHGAFGVGEHDRAEGRLRAALPSAVLLALFREVCRVPHRSPYQPDAVDPQVYDLLTATCNGPTIDDRSAVRRHGSGGHWRHGLFPAPTLLPTLRRSLPA